jgi:hypothetical protein
MSQRHEHVEVCVWPLLLLTPTDTHPLDCHAHPTGAEQMPPVNLANPSRSEQTRF